MFGWSRYQRKKERKTFATIRHTLHASMQFSSLFLVDTSINQTNITLISKIYALTHIKCMYANLLKEIKQYQYKVQVRLQIDQGLDANRPQFITEFFSKYKVHVLSYLNASPQLLIPAFTGLFFRKTNISLYWWTSSVTNWRFNQSRWGTLSSAWRIPSQL